MFHGLHPSPEEPRCVPERTGLEWSAPPSAAGSTAPAEDRHDRRLPATHPPQSDSNVAILAAPAPVAVLPPCSTAASTMCSIAGSMNHAGNSPPVQVWLHHSAPDRLPHVPVNAPGFAGRAAFTRAYRHRITDRHARAQILQHALHHAKGSSFGTTSSTTLGFSTATRSSSRFVSCRENSSLEYRRISSVRCVPSTLTLSTTV